VIEERDVEHTIYEVPLTLHAEGLDHSYAIFCTSKRPNPI
jgi:CTP synthase (UTP-ammonia lyase)